MKKIVAVILAAAMTLMMSMRIFALPGVTGETNGFGASSESGTVTWGEIDESIYSSETVELVNHINDFGYGTSVKSSVKYSFEGYQELACLPTYDIKSLYVDDSLQYLDDLRFLSPMRQLTFHDFVPTEEKPMEITFIANNMTDTMDVYAFYYCPVHGWELLETARTGTNQVVTCFHAGTSLAALVYIDKNAGDVLKMSEQTLAAPSVIGGTNGFSASSDSWTVIWDKIDESAYPSETVDFVNHINVLGSGSLVKDAFEGYQDLQGLPIFDIKSVYVGDGSQYLDALRLLSPLWQLTFIGIVPTEEKPVEVTFTANNMTDTMDIYVLYDCPIHGWELLEAARAGANQVTACFHRGTSLAALVYIDKGAGGNEGISPKTGENNTTADLAAAAVLLAALGFLALRKYKKTV